MADAMSQEDKGQTGGTERLIGEYSLSLYRQNSGHPTGSSSSARAEAFRLMKFGVDVRRESRRTTYILSPVENGAVLLCISNSAGKKVGEP